MCMHQTSTQMCCLVPCIVNEVSIMWCSVWSLLPFWVPLLALSPLILKLNITQTIWTLCIFCRKNTSDWWWSFWGNGRIMTNPTTMPVYIWQRRRTRPWQWNHMSNSCKVLFVTSSRLRQFTPGGIHIFKRAWRLTSSKDIDMLVEHTHACSGTLADFIMHCGKK